MPSSAQAIKQAQMSVKETIYWLERVDSTQLEIKRKLRENPDMAHLSAVVAVSQDKGRGRGVSKWHDTPGNSVLLSVLLRWPTPVKESFDVNRWVCSRLSSILPPVVSFKWPNDLMVDDRKLGGMLIENHWGSSGIKSSVLGLGINVRASEADLNRSISMKALDSEQAVEHWVQQIMTALRPLALEFADVPSLRKRYDELLWGRNKWQYYVVNGVQFEARVAHVQPSGHLGLELKNGTVMHYDLDTVQWVHPYSE